MRTAPELNSRAGGHGDSSSALLFNTVVDDHAILSAATLIIAVAGLAELFAGKPIVALCCGRVTFVANLRCLFILFVFAAAHTGLTLFVKLTLFPSTWISGHCDELRLVAFTVFLPILWVSFADGRFLCGASTSGRSLLGASGVSSTTQP